MEGWWASMSRVSRFGSAGGLDFGFFDFVCESDSVDPAAAQVDVEAGGAGDRDDDVEVAAEVWNDDGRNRIFTTSARSPWDVEYDPFLLPFPPVSPPSPLCCLLIQLSIFCRSSFKNSGYNAFNSSEYITLPSTGNSCARMDSRDGYFARSVSENVRIVEMRTRVK
jgi:hypothetical protein